MRRPYTMIITGAALILGACGGASSEGELVELLGGADGKGDGVDVQLVCQLAYDEPVDCSDPCNLPGDFEQRLLARGVPAELVPRFDAQCQASAPFNRCTDGVGSYSIICQTDAGSCYLPRGLLIGCWCQCGTSSDAPTGTVVAH